MKWFLGIDPGASGGMVILHEDGYTVDYVGLKGLSNLEIFNWINSEDSDLPTVATLEWIHPAIQRVGKASMSKLYGSFCSLQMALTASKIKFEVVKPRDWQRGVGVSPRRANENTTQWKKRLRDRAQQLFPNLELWKQSQSQQLGICDALLIAEYGRRNYN